MIVPVGKELVAEIEEHKILDNESATLQNTKSVGATGVHVSARGVVVVVLSFVGIIVATKIIAIPFSSTAIIIAVGTQTNSLER